MSDHFPLRNTSNFYSQFIHITQVWSYFQRIISVRELHFFYYILEITSKFWGAKINIRKALSFFCTIDHNSYRGSCENTSSYFTSIREYEEFSFIYEHTRIRAFICTRYPILHIYRNSIMTSQGRHNNSADSFSRGVIPIW